MIGEHSVVVVVGDKNLFQNFHSFAFDEGETYDYDIFLVAFAHLSNSVAIRLDFFLSLLLRKTCCFAEFTAEISSKKQTGSTRPWR